LAPATPLQPAAVKMGTGKINVWDRLKMIDNKGSSEPFGPGWRSVDLKNGQNSPKFVLLSKKILSRSLRFVPRSEKIVLQSPNFSVFVWDSAIRRRVCSAE
jgi:hypothetical protein